MADLRTPAEIKYDAERSGAAWLPVLAITDDPTNDGRDTPLSDAEARAIDILYPPIVRSRDAAHREERLIAMLERIAELPDPKQSEMLGYLTGLLDGLGK